MDTKVILSKSTYQRLAKSLNACKVSSPQNTENTHTELREDLGELFTFKRISNFPDDCLVDLAETIQDLYIERGNLDTYIYHTKQYLHTRLDKYYKKRDYYQKKINWMRSGGQAVTDNTLEKLDLIYLADTHLNGYHKYQADMFSLLLQLIHQLEKERMAK